MSMNTKFKSYSAFLPLTHLFICFILLMLATSLFFFCRNKLQKTATKQRQMNMNLFVCIAEPLTSEFKLVQLDSTYSCGVWFKINVYEMWIEPKTTLVQCTCRCRNKIKNKTNKTKQNIAVKIIFSNVICDPFFYFFINWVRL